MPGPIAPENQGVAGAGLLAYTGLVAVGSYCVTKYCLSKPPEETDEATDRTTPLSSTTPFHSAMIQY